MLLLVRRESLLRSHLQNVRRSVLPSADDVEKTITDKEEDG